MDTKVGLLSGGQRQALTLLMSTIVPPKLLLLDEHTAALDLATAEKIMAITNQIIQKNRLTTMMITHNIQSALSSGSRTVMMDSGKHHFGSFWRRAGKNDRCRPDGIVSRKTA